MTLSAVKNVAGIELLTGVLARPSELPEVETFRIAAYNLYNLFGAAPDVHSQRPNPPTPDDQLDALGEMIRSLDADAIAFDHFPAVDQARRPRVPRVWLRRRDWMIFEPAVRRGNRRRSPTRRHR